MTTFTIPAPPVAKGRPRTANGHAYTPAKTRKYEEMVAIYAAIAFPQPLDGPVHLRAEFWFEHPRSSWRKRTPLPEGWKTSKPDIDNLMKALEDGMNGIAYHDDSQIVWTVARKRYTAQGTPGRTVVTVEPVQP